MRVFIIFILSITIVFADNTSKTNDLKKKAEIAFKNKDYKKAESYYSELFNGKYKVTDDFAKLNFAHSQLLNNKTSEAQKTYQELTQSTEKVVKSISNQQLGNMASKNDELEQALSYYKNALKADPANEEARFNAELTKKKLNQNPPQNQDKKDENNKQEQKENQQNKDQKEQDKNDKGQQKDNKEDKGNKDKKESDSGKNGKDKEDKNGNKEENKDGKGKNDKDKKGQNPKEKEGKEGDTEKEDKKGKDDKENPAENQKGERDDAGKSEGKALENLKISPEKAKMLLDAMKNSEKQYLQQIKKEPTEKKNKSKPDW